MLDTTKKETRLLGEVQRLLLSRIQGEGRSTDILHPSELAKDSWCHRAGYYGLTGVKKLVKPTPNPYQMEMIWDEGKEIHKKWQTRFWEIGQLYGSFYCLHCQHSWNDTSPDVCSQCGWGREFLVYHEVPLLNWTKKVGGQADGQQGSDHGPIIEIKSLGVNSLRFENPALLAKHTYKFSLNGSQKTFVDLDGIWDDIQMPMPSAIRQGSLYNWLSGTTETIYIYECKWNQRCKEFVVKYRQERIQSILDRVDEINRALDLHEPPECIHGGCAECQAYEKGDDGRTEENQENIGGLSSGVGGSLKKRSVRRIPRRSTST